MKSIKTVSLAYLHSFYCRVNLPVFLWEHILKSDFCHFFLFLYIIYVLVLSFFFLCYFPRYLSDSHPECKPFLLMWIFPANIRQRLFLFLIPGVTFFLFHQVHHFPCVFLLTQCKVTSLLLSSDSFAQHCSITIPLRSSGTLFPPIFPSPLVYCGIYENLCLFSSYTRKSQEIKVSA